MSFHMDEIGLSDGTKLLQANITATGNVKSLSDSQSNADQSVKSADVSDTLSLSGNVSSNNNNDTLQQAGNIIDTANSGLSSISQSLSNIQTQIQAVQGDSISSADLSQLSTSIQQDLKNIDNTSQNTSFNKTNLLDGSNTSAVTVDVNGNSINVTSGLGDNTLKGLNLPSTDSLSLNSIQDVQSLTKQVSQAAKAVADQQSILQETKDKIIKAVGSLVVIGQGSSDQVSATTASPQSSLPAITSPVTTTTPSQTTTDTTSTTQSTNTTSSTGSSSNAQSTSLSSQLQNNAVSSISQNPQTSLNIQISSLDSNLLLAMLCLQPTY